MEQMILAGMNVARLNFSHGEFCGHQAIIRGLHAAERSTGRGIPIMADLPRPKNRVGQIKSKPIQLKAGSAFKPATGDVTGDETDVSTTFQRLSLAVERGSAIFLNDGLFSSRLAAS